MNTTDKIMALVYEYAEAAIDADSSQEKFYEQAIRKEIEALVQQDAQAVVQGWRVERVSDDDVRVCGPDAETWILCKNAGKGTFEDFAYRFFFALASCPQPEAAPAVAQQDDAALLTQCLTAVEAMMQEFRALDLPYGSKAYALAKDCRLDLIKRLTTEPNAVIDAAMQEKQS